MILSLLHNLITPILVLHIYLLYNLILHILTLHNHTLHNLVTQILVLLILMILSFKFIMSLMMNFFKMSLRSKMILLLFMWILEDQLESIKLLLILNLTIAIKWHQASPLHQSSSAYPLSSVLSYNHLSPSYKSYCNYTSSNTKPTYYHQVVNDPQWQEAMAALEANKTWTLTPLPTHKQPIGCKWVYRKYK